MKLNMRLTPRITLVFATFAVVLLISVGTLSYRSGRQALEAAAIAELLASSLAKEAQIDSWVQTRTADIAILAKSPKLLLDIDTLSKGAPQPSRTAAHAGVIAELLPRTTALPRMHLMMAVADIATGTIIAATDSQWEGKSVSAEAWFTNGKNSTYIESPHRSAGLRSATMTISTPLFSGQGALLGVLVGWLDLNSMNAILLQRSGLNYSDEAYLLNQSSEIVTAPRFLPSVQVLSDKLATEATQRCVAGYSGVLFANDYRGLPSITVYRWLPKYRLALITSIRRDEALESVREFGESVALIVALILLVTLLAALTLARSITRPIHALTTGVARFGHGELDVRLPVNSQDELGILAREFNNMAAAISEKENLLRTNATELEQRVAERTYVLQQQADLLDLANDAIIVCDRAGIIRFWNQRAEEMYGWSSAAAIGQPLDEFLQTQAFPLSMDELHDLLTKTGRWECELAQRRADGELIIVLSRQALQRDQDGNATVTLQINSDITGQKRAEEDLQRAKESAEAAATAKGAFLANMSHEIRTPMNGVIGLINVMLTTPVSAQQREYLELIKTSADSLLRLLNDILDLSKMDAGRLGLDPIAFDLRESLGNCLKSFAATANEKGVELMYEVAPTVPQIVVADAGRLNQIVVNLVGNAMKFTRHGEVVLRVYPTASDTQQCMLTFSVSDTGIGMTPDQLRNIFDAFAQADVSTTREYGGTGLGLTIVAELVRLMNGTVEVDSEAGRGTVVRFTIACSVVEESTDGGPFLASDLKNMAVLVVDDNYTNRLILQEILLNWGMCPVLAEHGEQALALLNEAAGRGTPFPLVLVDSQMPGFDGFQLTEAINATAALKNATIMMLSSSDMAGEIGRCNALGVWRFLRKPVKPSELFNAILSASGGTSPAAAELAIGMEPPPSRILRVLVAEDHPINQRLVLEILHARGHVCSVAVNGVEVLRKLEHENFDAILMDGQMPEMDGYQTTENIRRREQLHGGHIHIIAVTANAMREDRERCYAAGMDDYISKPIDAHELLRMLEGGLTRDDLVTREQTQRAAASAAAPAAALPPAEMIFDAVGSLKRARDKVSLLRQLIAMYLQELPQSLEAIQSALELRDARAIEQHAHRLKGASITIGANRVARAAQSLERLGRSNSIDTLPAAVAELMALAAELRHALDIYQEESR